ncbi:MAG: hypothetical protein HZA16_06740 [Nitrospirae bacterium]|nr:hypothetical protein [Nitrospirota bacterium]
METFRKLSPRLKSYLISLGLSAALLISLIVFIKGPSFINFIEIIISSLGDRPVEIGGLSLKDRHRLIIRDLVIKEGREGGPHIIVPHAEIRFNLRRLLRKNIDIISIDRPALSMLVKKGKDRKDGEGKTTLPFTVNNLFINDAAISLQLEKGKSYNISSVNVSLRETGQKGKSELRGDAFIPEINSGINVDAIVNIEEFNIERAHAEVRAADLEILSALAPLTFFEDVEIKGKAGAVLDVTPEDASRPDEIAWRYEMALNNVSVRTKTLGLDFKDRSMRLYFRGAYDTRRNVMDLERLEARIDRLGLLTARGTVAKPFSGKPDINIEAAVQAASLDILKETVSGPAVKWLDKIYMDGRASAEFSVKGEPGTLEINGTVSASGESIKAEDAELKTCSIALPLIYRDGGLVFNDAVLHAKKADYFNVPDRTDLLISVNDTTLMFPRVEYREPRTISGIFQLESGQAIAVRKGKQIFIDTGIVIKGAVEGDLSVREIRINPVSLNTDSIKGVEGGISLGLDKQAVADVSLSWENVDIGGVAQRFGADVLKGKGLSVHGKGDVYSAVKITLPENAPPTAAGTVNLGISKAGFSSSDETIVGEGMEIHVAGGFEFPVPPDRVNFSVNGEAAGFELLMGKFYGDFKNRAVSFSSQGTYTQADALIKISRGGLGLSGAGNINFSGDISDPAGSPHYDMEIGLENLSVDDAYGFFIKDTFKEQYPVLGELTAGGTVSASLSVNGTKDSFTLEGAIGAVDVNIKGGDGGLSASGVNMMLPVDMSWPEALHSGKRKDFGFLKAADFSWKALRFTDLELVPVVRENALIFRDEVVLPLFDGGIMFQNISYTDLLSPDRELRLSIDIQGVDLGKLTASLDMPPINGSLSGTVPRVTLTGNRLLTEGQIDLRLLDGHIRVSAFSIDDVAGPVASIKAGIEIKDIDLEKLTGAFDFGHISGVLEGDIDDLVIVNGQAEGFKASIETVKKKGIAQKISVDALKKISILGTGATTSILDRGIYRLFKQYGYEKIGFKAYLKNDNLLLLGVKREEGKQYLVEGGLLPPRVDVVTYSQNISFKEIVNRLKRIGAAGKD